MAAREENGQLKLKVLDGADMKNVLIVLAVIVVIALIFGGSFIGRRNQMAIKKEAVNAAWSQVDVVLQRRGDLIPNLVETVKGYAAQEQTVFGDIAKARSALLSAHTPGEKIAANTQLDGALGRLLVVVENYPQLKSNENFLRLQDELAGTENRIAVERRSYNQVVQDYNTFIATFPNSLVASMSGFSRNDAYFKTEEGARQAPKVNFGTTPAAPSSQPAPAKP
jgi:LemA protein